jgi:Flp pilus assembly pilin Flp
MSYERGGRKMKSMPHQFLKRERGAATLLVTVILLALITLVSVYVTKIGLFEMRTSANANRAKEALHNAQAGLDFGALRFLNEGASWADGTIEVVPLLNGASVAVRGVINSSLVTVQASGESLDNTGLANVSESYGRYPLLAFGELPPLMSNGNFPPSGTFSIVANPNGGGDGVPVSAWVQDGTTGGGASWQTCLYDEFLYEGLNAAQAKDPIDEDGDGVPEFIGCDTCSCKNATNTLCEAGDVANASDCDDVVVQDSGMPEVFRNTFGQPVTDWETYMGNYAQKMSCAQLNAYGESVRDQFESNELPIVWVDEDCSLAENIGTYEKPVIIFVHGDVTLNGGDEVYGIVFAFSEPAAGTDPDTPTLIENNELKLTGTPTVYGVILVNADVDLPNGNFTLVYSQNLLENLYDTSGDEFFGIGRRAGSWTDFN